MRILLLLCSLIVISCGHLPRTDAKIVRFKSKTGFLKKSSEKVVIYESEYPAGIIQNGSGISASKKL